MPNIPVLLKKIPTVVNSRKVPGVIMLYRDGREYRVVCTSSTLSCAGVLQVEGLKVLREGQRYAEAVSQEYPEKLISKFNAK
ncbi:hypothetical protein [Thermogymnomonas acidicola]|uniref:hypothetical protein n=1 Tax=Thermogymnomonas acidicola TaxID=399579 RepID=UPI000946833E|nr:hypothetical protein [Thermogymnomonas acidicola]